MLRLTLDAFSGRDNPTWLMPAMPAIPILRRIASDLNFVIAPEAVPPVLGYRGLNLQILSPDLRLRFNLPPWLSLVPGSAGVSPATPTRWPSCCGLRRDLAARRGRPTSAGCCG